MRRQCLSFTLCCFVLMTTGQSQQSKSGLVLQSHIPARLKNSDGKVSNAVGKSTNPQTNEPLWLSGLLVTPQP